MTSNDNICAVYITYANRARLLEQAVRGCYTAGVDKVIVVDNKSDERSQEIFRRMKKAYGERIKIVHLKENKGAAGGFKKGLKAVMKEKKCDLVWLMDDDCVPEKDSLKKLLELWDEKRSGARKDDRNGDEIAMMSMRFSLPDYLHMSDEELKIDNLEKELLNPNAFCFFSVSRAFSLMARLVFKRTNEKKKGERRAYKRRYVETVIAPFGSLLFKRKLINKVGFPKEEFFTYFSDTEYTYRMHKKHGVRIFLVPASKVKDIDFTFQHGYIRTYFSVGKIIENFHNMEERKMYYEFRNRILFERQLLVKNKVVYLFNKIFFLGLIYPAVRLAYWIRYRDDKMKSFSKAIRDGTQMKIQT